MADLLFLIFLVSGFYFIYRRFVPKKHPAYDANPQKWSDSTIILSIFFVVFIFIALFVFVAQLRGPDKEITDEKVRAPSIQQVFELTRTGKLDEYKAAKNEIIKSSLFNSADAEMNAIISKQGKHLINWSGQIKTIRTSHSGTDVHVVIVSQDNVEYSIEDDAKAGSALYKQIALLQVGQRVSFTGKLKPTLSGKKWEFSLTELGSLENPEFQVRFESIIPFDNVAISSIAK
jgi:hypothetical protein